MSSISSVLSLIAAEISVLGSLAVADAFRSCTVTWGQARSAHSVANRVEPRATFALCIQQGLANDTDS